ncbi:hypothetical protein RDI58_017824 [Solanum bulbocastanum]|uniref:Uncharacterized protein n=1 Tax=Solanum bulbocastanum TaxID=147425 RepID=A0AAN8TD17_SOLBU
MWPWIKKLTEPARLQPDVHALDAAAKAASDPTPETEVDDLVLSALFSDEIPALNPLHAASKRTYLSESH